MPHNQLLADGHNTDEGAAGDQEQQQQLPVETPLVRGDHPWWTVMVRTSAPRPWHLDNGAQLGEFLANGLRIVNQLRQDLFLLKTGKC